MTFDSAMQEAKSRGKGVHALLGNGFSRACRDDIFKYGALFERADFRSLSPSARKAFDALGTTDFEVVIDALRQGTRLLPLYHHSPQVATQMKSDADGLREVLVQAIASSHPDQPNEIPDEQYRACRSFIAHFDKIYTLNYDLLLYWAGMHAEDEPNIKFDDGFRNSDEEGADFVVWDPGASNRDQMIFYVHGALHLFDAGEQLVKYTWNRTGVRLINQVRAALEEEKYPLFVAEGKSSEKLRRIRHHAYLGRIERSFLEIQGSLFVYGVSCGESDDHILNWIAKGKVDRIYLGVFGDPASTHNRRMCSRASDAARRRRKGKPPEVEFFDASSAHVWG